MKMSDYRYVKRMSAGWKVLDTGTLEKISSLSNTVAFIPYFVYIGIKYTDKCSYLVLVIMYLSYN